MNMKNLVFVIFLLVQTPLFGQINPTKFFIPKEFGFGTRTDNQIKDIRDKYQNNVFRYFKRAATKGCNIKVEELDLNGAGEAAKELRFTTRNSKDTIRVSISDKLADTVLLVYGYVNADPGIDTNYINFQLDIIPLIKSGNSANYTQSQGKYYEFKWNKNIDPDIRRLAVSDSFFQKKIDQEITVNEWDKLLGKENNCFREKPEGIPLILELSNTVGTLSIAGGLTLLKIKSDNYHFYLTNINASAYSNMNTTRNDFYKKIKRQNIASGITLGLGIGVWGIGQWFLYRRKPQKNLDSHSFEKKFLFYPTISNRGIGFIYRF